MGQIHRQNPDKWEVSNGHKTRDRPAHVDRNELDKLVSRLNGAKAHFEACAVIAENRDFIMGLSDRMLIELLERTDNPSTLVLLAQLTVDRFMADGIDAAKLAILLQNTKPSDQVKDLVYQLASKSLLFGPDGVDDDLKAIPEGCHAQIIEGIVSRIKKLGTEDQLAVIEKYLAMSSSPQIIDSIQSTYIEIAASDSLPSMETRLLEIPGDLARKSDTALVDRYERAGDVDASVNYVNKLIATNRLVRAGSCANQIASSPAEDRAALTEWAFDLPNGIPERASTASMAFMSWYYKDRKSALDFLSSQTDKEILSSLKAVVSAEERKRARP